MFSSSLPLLRLALVLLLSLSFTSPLVRAFHNETLLSVQFSATGGFTNKGTFTCTLDGVVYNIQSTTTLGAVASAEFQGTAVYLLALVDSIDRGSYDINVDGGPITTVAGSSTTRQCAYLYSKTGLPYQDHTITVNNAHANPNNATFTKFEFLAFVVTMPDAADLPSVSAPAAPSSTAPTSISIPNSNPTNSSGSSNLATSSSSSLSAGAIAGIAIGAVAIVAIAVVILVIYFHNQRRNRRYSTTQSFYNVPGGPGGYSGGGGGGGGGAAGPAEITPFPTGYAGSPAPYQHYTGGAEVMTMQPHTKSVSSLGTGHGYDPGQAGGWASAAAGVAPGRLTEADIDRIAQRMAMMNAQAGPSMQQQQQPVFQQMSNPHLRAMLEEQRTGSTTTAPIHVPVPQRASPESSRYPPEKVPLTPAPNYDPHYRG